MKGSQDADLKMRLKMMILEECEKEDDIIPENVPEDARLFSKESGLDLDSLDALSIIMGLQQQFGIRLPDSKAFRRHVTTINELADFIQPE
ncbi:MAG TPA: acyl carrier protein [Desulfarculaceae bacterium]|nr:acyl carrier protein [Desulfarculaceae bacterium]